MAEIGLTLRGADQPGGTLRLVHASRNGGEGVESFHYRFTDSDVASDREALGEVRRGRVIVVQASLGLTQVEERRAAVQLVADARCRLRRRASRPKRRDKAMSPSCRYAIHATPCRTFTRSVVAAELDASACSSARRASSQ